MRVITIATVFKYHRMRHYITRLITEVHRALHSETIISVLFMIIRFHLTVGQFGWRLNRQREIIGGWQDSMKSKFLLIGLVILFSICLGVRRYKEKLLTRFRKAK